MIEDILESLSAPTFRAVRGEAGGLVLAAANQALAALLRRPPASLHGRRLDELLPLAAAQAARRLLEPGHGPVRSCRALELASGATVDLLLQVVRRDDGRLEVLGTLFDAAPRGGAEPAAASGRHQAAAHQRGLETLCHAAPVGLALLDGELRCVWVNETLAAMHGLPAAAHPGRRLSEVAPWLEDRHEALLRQALEAGAVPPDLAWTVPDGPGRRGGWTVQACPILDEAGRLQGVGLLAEAGTALSRARGPVERRERRLRLALDAAGLEVWARDLVAGTVTAEAPAPWSRSEAEAELALHPEDRAAVREGAEAELERSRARTALALAAAEAGTWDWDLASGRIAWSEGIRRLLEGSDGGGVDRYAGFLARVLPADRPELEAALARALDGREPYRTEYRIVAGDGSVRWLEGRGEVRCDAAGRPVEVIGVTLDVTTRKAAEAALGQSRQRLLQALAAGGQVAFETDLATATYRVEAGTPTWLGWPVEALPRTREAFLALVHPEDRGQFTGDIRSLERGGPIASALDYRLRAADGTYRWIRGQVEVIAADADGRPLRLIAIATDIDARRRAELALEDSNRRLAIALKAGAISVWETDLVAGTIAIDDTGCRRLGLGAGPQTLPLREHEAFIHPDYRAAVHEVQRTVEPRGVDALEHESRMVRADGSAYWVQRRGEVTERDAAGRPTKLVGVTVDITARKEAEERLRESEARLRAVIESLPFDLWVLDQDGRYVLQNAASRGLWGERIGQRPEDLEIPPELLAQWRENNRRALAGEVVRNEAEHRVGGAVRHVEEILAPVRDGAAVLGAVGIGIDVTALKAAEAAARARLAELEALYDQAPVGLALLDRELRYLRVNKRQVKWNARPAAAHLGKWIWDVVPDARAILEPLFRQVLATGERLGDVEYVSPPRPGFPLPRTWLVQVYPVKNAQGQTVALGTIVQEISQRKEAEARLRESEARLRATIESLPFELWFLGRDGRYALQNAVSRHRWGERIGLRPEDSQVAPELLAEWRATNARAMAGETLRREWVDRSGERPRHVEVILAPVRDGEAILGVVGIGIDVTAIMEAQARLRESEGMLRLALQAGRAIVWGRDLEAGTIWHQAGSLAELDLLFPAELGEAAWLARVPAEDRPGALERLERQRAGDRGEFRSQHRVRADDGRHVWLETVGRVVEWDAAGRGRKVLGIAVDVTDRKEAEAALRASEHRLRVALEAGRLSVWERDFEARTFILETRFLPWLGLGEGPVTLDEAEYFARFVHPDDVAGIRERAARMAADPTARPRGLIRLRRADGGYGWIAVENVARWSEESGRPVGSIGIVADVTEAIQAEQLVRTSRERLRMALRATGQLVWEIDRATGATFVEAGQESWLGWPVDRIDVDVEAWLERTHPDDRPQVEAALAALFTGAQDMRSFEYRWQRADGGYSWVLDHAAVVERWPDGTARRVAGAIIDIDARKRVEQALQASEARLRLALSAGRVQVWERDFVRRTFRMVGEPCPGEAFHACDVDIHEDEAVEFIHPDDRPAWLAKIAALREGATDEVLQQVRSRREDGGYFWIDLHGRLTERDVDGRGLRAMGVRADITAAKEAELALERARAEVEAALAAERNANLMLRSFVAMASHEIRTPLAIIAASAEFVAGEAEFTGDEALLTRARRIRNGVARLVRLVKRLLEGERASAGRAVFRPQPVDPAELLTECVANARLDHPIREIRTFGIWPTLRSVAVDRGLLEVALHTLIGNAVKFSKRHTPVTVALEADAAGVRFVVRDEGIGIPASELAQVGARFFRASNAAGRSGSGLGLALAREVAALHGGEVRIDSREGQGTTAALCLPWDGGPAAPG